MRRLTVLAVLLVGFLLAYVLVDIAAKGFVEGRVEEAFRDDPRLDVEEVSFAIDSFPFLARLGLLGEVSASLHLGGVRDRGITIDEFDLEVDGLVFDRSSAFNGDVRVNGLDEATTSVRLGEVTLGDLLGTPVSIGANGTVTAGGVTVRATLAGGELVLEGEGIGTTTVPVPLTRYLPCDPEVAVADQQVVLTCVTEELPPIVNRVLGEARLGG